MHRYVRLVPLLTVTMALFLWASPAHADGTHVVQPGESLLSIAARYGVSAPAIMQANGLDNPDMLYAGQSLRIPTGDNTPAPAPAGTYVVRPGDTLFSIARRLGVSQSALMQANGITNAGFIWAGQQLRVPGQLGEVEPGQQSRPVLAGTGLQVHVVAPGETLFSIAARYGVTASSVAQANALRAADQIFAGQQLVIPAAQSRPAVSVASQGKWIEVDVGRQRLVAHEGDRAVFSAVVSTGKAGTPTVLGRFAIGTKLTSQRMIGPGYDIPNVPWVMYFHGAYAIHGAYWHNEFGRPISHGCVNMRPADAQWLFNWAPAGTPVVVHR